MLKDQSNAAVSSLEHHMADTSLVRLVKQNLAFKKKIVLEEHKKKKTTTITNDNFSFY